MIRLARRITNRSLDYLLFNRGIEHYWLNRMRGKVLCLLYHRVDEPERHVFLTRGGIPVITPEELETDLRFLVERGARFLTFSDLKNGDFPTRDEIGIVLTFDDGFQDNYTTALDVLDIYGVRAVIFQSTAMVDSKVLIWEHALYWYSQDYHRRELLKKMVATRLNKHTALNSLEETLLAGHLRENIPAPMLEEMLESLMDDGIREQQQLIAEALYPKSEQLRRAVEANHEIGSHGHHHYKRANINDEIFEQELTESRQRLGDILGYSPTAFSYPFNSRKPGDRETCGRYFRQIATVDGGFVEHDYDPLAITRVTWPGPARNSFRRRRWLTTGRI